MAFLDVNNLSKHFTSANVLNNINFNLNEGEVLAVIGASGSGKTTLLRCLNFLEKPDTGYIAVRGETLLYDDAAKNKEKRRFGLVFQTFNLFPHCTALKNVTLACELAAKKLLDYKKNKKRILDEIQREGMQLLDKIGLSSKWNLFPHQLSGGQQQRIAIARALALKPDILCLDEPTSALDPELTGEVLKVIRALAQQKTTMIIVTHEIRFARDAADFVLFLDEGSIAEYGTPDILDNPSCERLKRFLSSLHP